jgi:tRNA A-37 threonylcarbamoyl transferase component Bud32
VTTTAASDQNGFTWRFREGVSPDILRSLIAGFPELHGLPGVSVLKENRFRTVFRIPPALLHPGDQPPASAPPPAVAAGAIVKVYRYTKAWDRFRYRFLRHRAEQEWVALGRFLAAGLPAPLPLAVGELRAGGTAAGGGLITAFLDGTVPLVGALQDRLAGERGLPDGARALLADSGRLVRRLHDHGIWHRDLHAANILVARESGALHFIDLHSCYFFRRLAGWQRRAGFAKLLVSLEKTVPAEGLRVLIAAYGADALDRRGDLAAAEARLLARVRGLERRRLKSRSRRCFLPSTQFTVEKHRGVRLYHARAFRPEDLARLWTVEPCGPVLKSSAKGWVAAADLAGRRVCVKRRRYTLLASLQCLIESHDLRRAYGGGHALRVRGIPAPQVIALRERRVLGAVREAHLVTELIADAAPLDEHVRRRHGERLHAPILQLSPLILPGPACGAAAREKRLLARAVGELVRRIHDAGFAPHDLSPQNLLVAGDALARAAEAADEAAPFLYWVDLDHLYLWKPLFPWRRRRNLIQVASLHEGQVTAADRLRALKAYARGEAWCFAPAFRRALERGFQASGLAAVLTAVRRERSTAAAASPRSLAVPAPGPARASEPAAPALR